MGYKSWKSGKDGEDITMMALKRFGCHFVTKIETPMTIKRGKRVYTASAMGDYFGQWHDGQSLLVEAKKLDGWTKEDINDIEVARKVWNGWRKVLKPHQKENLAGWSIRGRAILSLVSGDLKHVRLWLVNSDGPVSSDG